MKIKGRTNSYAVMLGNFEDKELINMTHSIWSEQQIYLRQTKSPTRGNKLPDGDKYNHLLKILFSNDRKRLGYSLLERLEGRPEIERRGKPFCENELQKVLLDIHLLDIGCDEDIMSLGDFVFDTGCNLQKEYEIERGGPKPFSNLKSLKLYDCSNLEKLFPLGLLSSFQNMERLFVESCEDLEELMEGAPDGTKLGIGHPKVLSFPKLQRIFLQYLPNLKSLCSDDKVIGTPHQHIRIMKCRKLKRMAFDVDDQPQPFLQIEYEKKEKEWVESLEWDPP